MIKTIIPKNNHTVVFISIIYLLLSCFSLISCSSIDEKNFNYNDISNYLYNPNGDDLVYVYSIKGGDGPYIPAYYHYKIDKINGSVLIHIDKYDDSFTYSGYIEFKISENSIVYTKLSSFSYKDSKYIIYDDTINKSSFINCSFTIERSDINNELNPTCGYLSEKMVKAKFTDKELLTPSISCFEAQFMDIYTYKSQNGNKKTHKILNNESFLYNVRQTLRAQSNNHKYNGFLYPIRNIDFISLYYIEI